MRSSAGNTRRNTNITSRFNADMNFKPIRSLWLTCTYVRYKYVSTEIISSNFNFRRVPGAHRDRFPWDYLRSYSRKQLKKTSSTVWKFYFQNISRVFMEYVHTTKNISILWNWTKLWKLDFQRFSIIFPIFFHTMEKRFL